MSTRMLLRLQDYNLTLKYQPGEEMAIANTQDGLMTPKMFQNPYDHTMNNAYANSRRWNYSTWRSNYDSPRREEDETEITTPRTSRNIKISEKNRPMHILAWHQQ